MKTPPVSSFLPSTYCKDIKRGNRFKGLYLIEYLKNCGWKFITLYRRQ